MPHGLLLSTLASSEKSELAPNPAALQISKVSKRNRRDPASDEISSLAPETVDAPTSKMTKRAKQAAQPAQPARQRAVQLDVLTLNAGTNDGRIVGKGGACLSTAPAVRMKSPQDAPKEQGSFGSRNASNVPSTNPVSKESQAGLQANLDPVISSPAIASTSSNGISTFSTFSAENTNNSK